jgi:antitoxin (DNA-binding transcriptional repressor) of toxin-antitoxin stability system
MGKAKKGKSLHGLVRSVRKGYAVSLHHKGETVAVVLPYDVWESMNCKLVELSVTRQVPQDRGAENQQARAMTLEEKLVEAPVDIEEMVGP